MKVLIREPIADAGVELLRAKFDVDVDGDSPLEKTIGGYEAIVIRSKPHAKKVRNLAHDPRAMVALGDAEDDFDVGLLEARAEVTVGDDAPPAPLPSARPVRARARSSPVLELPTPANRR